MLVDRDRNRDETERGDEIEHAREAGILDRDPVAGSQPREQHPLDAVEGAADRDDALGRHAVGAEGEPRRVVERGQRRGFAVGLRRRRPPGAGGRATPGAARGRDCRDARSTTPAGMGGSAAIGKGGLARDDRAPPAGAAHETAMTERAVRGGHRRRRQVERGRELAHGRQPPSDRKPAARDQPLDRVGQFRCGPNLELVQWWYRH